MFDPKMSLDDFDFDKIRDQIDESEVGVLEENELHGVQKGTIAGFLLRQQHLECCCPQQKKCKEDKIQEIEEELSRAAHLLRENLSMSAGEVMLFQLCFANGFRRLGWSPKRYHAAALLS